ncbi:hypothetical protein Tco_0875635 [Tanacetum coccineum]|uniref:Uncharacterized protein n=1 Tax=Tanacetum coccineum TaxID=301880 RepID=A0ABQ5BVP0_9ASTR
MNPVATQQIAHDNALVTPKKRLKIERCNARIKFSKPLKAETYKVTLDALKLSLCYPAFQITAEVPEIYMHQFWNTIKKIGKTYAHEFKLDKKKCRVDTEVFYEILQICPRLPNQDFMELPSEDRTFAAVINRCISGKSTGLDRPRESRAQALWDMYNQKNVDYVALLMEDFMYQADNREISSARKEHMPYPRFTKVFIDNFISKDNSISMRNRINLHTAHDDSLLAYKTYLDYATGKVPPKKARKFKKPASPKLKIIPASPKEPTQKDTPAKSVSKKIAPAKTDRGKGIELLSDDALLEDAQLKKMLRKSKRETHKLQANGLRVPDVSKEDSSDSDDDSWGNNEDENDDFNDEDDDGGNDDDSGSNDDGDNDVQDNEQTDSDDDKNPSFTLKDYEEEEQHEEYVFTPEKDKSGDEEKMYEEEDDDVAKELYGDLNITQGLRDTDMTNVEQGREDLKNASHKSGFVQEEDDGYVTLTTVHDKTEGTIQSSSISFDFKSKPLNLDSTGLDVNEIASLMNTVTFPHSSPLVNPSSHLITTPQQQTPDSTTTTTNPTITLLEIPNFASQFGFEQRCPPWKLKCLSSTKQVNLLKLSPLFRALLINSTMKAILKEQVKAQVSKIMPQIENQRNQIHLALPKAPNLSLNLQTSDKPPTHYRAWNKSKSIDSRPPQKWISTITKARQPPCTFNELMDTPIDFSAYVMNRLKIDNLTQEILVWPPFNLLKGSCKSFAELEYHFEECYKAVNDRLDWHNPEGREYPFDLSKPLPLIEDRGRQVVVADYFINNDLEFLKGGSSSSKYATSIKRTKAAKFYAYACHWKSPHDVYSKRRIIAITIVKVMRWYDYGYLEEIVVRRDDNVLYKFKEGNFSRLNLCDIEDMLLLLVQKKLSNLDVDDRYDLGVALRMFTRRIIILHRVQDLQRGVESYQRKLKITRPETTRSNISKLTPYTAYKNPQGIIYHDKYKRNRLMRSGELYKFCDGTLSSVTRVLHDIASNLEMDYLPKRHWSNLEMKRSRIMVKAIDKLLFERRLMRNFKKFVGGRDYGNDLRLLERKI